jgi:hypothetical protein
MPSVCIRTILFTPTGKSVHENKYVEIFLLWLSQLIKSGDLQHTDAFELLIDTPTYDKLQQTSFNELRTALRCQTTYYKLPQPTTLTEGCMWKYLTLEYTQDIFFYCDIDVLITKPIRSLTDSMNHNTVYAHAEGMLFNPIYGSNFACDFPKETLDALSKDSPGYSAGKFFIYGKDLRNRVFNYIQTLHSLRQTDYPMLEQPFYNRALYELESTFILNTTVLSKEVVCTNNRNYRKEVAVLFDCCGIPGDDMAHIHKLICLISLLNSGVY